MPPVTLSLKKKEMLLQSSLHVLNRLKTYNSFTDLFPKGYLEDEEK